MKQMTEQNMINAFGGECQAHMRYLRFAEPVEGDAPDACPVCKAKKERSKAY